MFNRKRVRELERELNRLQLENLRLQTDLSSFRTRARLLEGRPDFQEVARDFSAEGLDKKVQSRIIEDFVDLLSREALNVLRTAFHQLPKRHTAPRLRVAYDMRSEQYCMQITLPEVNREVWVHRDHMQQGDAS